MLTVEISSTHLVVTGKVPVLAPAGTVTLAGTVACDVLLLKRPTARPPEGAGPLKVTVPVTVAPPITLVGLRVTEVSVSVSEGAIAEGVTTGGVTAEGVTISPADLVTPPTEAEMVTVELCPTG